MAIDESRLPTGDCAGKSIPDRGNRTGVTDTYGAEGAFDSGINGRSCISSTCKSDGKREDCC